MAKTKQQTDIEIAKKIVKEQKERRKNNFKEFKDTQGEIKERKEDWKKRLKDNKYV